jgi:alpha-glucosidase
MAPTLPHPPKSEHQAWWQTGVIYQIYPRSFGDTTGNGIGDLQGIIDHLDYLNGDADQSLGVDAIWISPFYPSPMADLGYDVADYCDIEALFGDLATLDRLVAEAHAREIRVVIDYVPNHSSDRHPWFIESRSSRDNPKRNWYIWSDGRPDGSLPNNWGSPFGGPAWTLDPPTGQFYLHQFLPEQPELNWREPDLVAAMLEVLRFWLDRGVDGFRMDVVGMILKDADLRNNPPNPAAEPTLHADDIFGRQLHVFNEDQDDVHEVIRMFRSVLDEYSDRVAIGELGYGMSRWVKYYGTDGDGLHLPFNFRLMHTPWEAGEVRRSVEKLEATLPSWAWPSYVLGSHDAPRLASRIGATQARVAAMLLLTLRGTPTLYQGDELGIENGMILPDQLQDPQGLRLGMDRSRDPSRTPMQWDAGPHAGFSTTESWLPLSADHRIRNVATQAEDPTSMLTLYRCLLEYRRSTQALTVGRYESVPSGRDNECFTFRRRHLDSDRLIALNLTGEEHRLSIPDDRPASIELSTHLDRLGSIALHDFTLRPDEGVIIEVER